MPPRLTSGNLFADLPAAGSAEQLLTLWKTPNLTVERIVSQGQSTPPGQWYDQESDEWVVLLTGAARLTIAGCDMPVELRSGDYVFLPARVKHRVEWTSAEEVTVWLAVHGPPTDR